MNQEGERAFFTALTDSKVDTSDLVVNVFGDVAIATFDGAFSGKMGGKPIGAKMSTMEDRPRTLLAAGRAAARGVDPGDPILYGA